MVPCLALLISAVVHSQCIILSTSPFYSDQSDLNALVIKSFWFLNS